jgi:hypothetical protein
MSDDDKTLLLEEYKICHERIGRFDTIIWQIAAVIFPLSLAGIFYFGTSEIHSSERFLVVFASAAGSTSIILSWHFLSREWIKYQYITLRRAREIEGDLNFWTYRYTNYVSSSKIQRRRIEDLCDDEEKIIYFRLNKDYKVSSFIGYPRIMMTVVYVFIIGWIGVILREGYFVF